MANHPSALKRMRQAELRRQRNQSFKSRVKTTVKKLLVAAEENPDNAQTLLVEASSLLQKGVSKGVFHKNTASRTISRLSKKVSKAS